MNNIVIRFVAVLLMLFFFLGGQAQKSDRIFQHFMTELMERPQLSLEIDVKAFDKEKDVLIDQTSFIIKRWNDKFYTEQFGIEVIVDGDLILEVDHHSKRISLIEADMQESIKNSILPNLIDSIFYIEYEKNEDFEVFEMKEKKTNKLINTLKLKDGKLDQLYLHDSGKVYWKGAKIDSYTTMKYKHNIPSNFPTIEKYLRMNKGKYSLRGAFEKYTFSNTLEKNRH